MDEREMIRRIEKLEREVADLKEDYKLSDYARKTLEEARKAPKSEYVELSEL